ncbi:hypothetical protein LguiB_010052 [Lonicera macranthoides]
MGILNHVVLGVMVMLCNGIGVKGELNVGFYSQTCPNAESIVMSVVKDATASNSRILPILLRLHFHDCFVEGCDGSILIDDGENIEKGAFGHEGVKGFDEIELAKTKLEVECPGVVSCADIVAMAARDAVFLSGGPHYQVETGRRDGRVSKASLAADMPDVNDSIDTLKSKFMNKGLPPKDLVLLTAGAHTIGTTACFFMPVRLYNFTGKDDTDPSINPQLLPKLKRRCPINGDVNVRIPLDPVTSEVFDDQVIRNIKNGFAVIASDARLYDDDATKETIESYLKFASQLDGSFFGTVFPEAMVRMGQIGVKTGSNGEIRRVCHSFN